VKLLARTIVTSLIAATAMSLIPGKASANVAVVNFDDQPTGPPNYSEVPAPQTLVYAAATFTGGVVLGDASAFPAIAYATAPNVYATADFGNGLSQDLTITVDNAFATTEVSFALFNGETVTRSYEAQAFSGSTMVASQSLDIAGNGQSGYGLVDLLGPDITSVVISQVNNQGNWDFLLDTVAFNESIQTAVSSVPEPSNMLLIAASMGLMGVISRRRQRD